MFRVQWAGARALGAVFAKHPELLGSQPDPPLLLCFGNVHPRQSNRFARLAAVRTAIALTLLSVAALSLMVWSQQRRLIYFPFGGVPEPADIGLEGATAVTFEATDGLSLNGWFVSRTANPAFTVVVFNGNAGHRAMRAPLANALTRAGMSVLLFDYRGFGGNPGSPSESGLRADARGALQYVLNRSDVDKTRVAYLGESLGAAVAAELAVEHPPAALILRSPFTSLTDVGKVHYGFLPVGWLLRDRFATIDRIARVRAPLLVIAGDRDRIVPAEQSRRVYLAANEPKSLVVIDGADHNDHALLAGREMIDQVISFLAQAGKSAA